MKSATPSGPSPEAPAAVKFLSSATGKDWVDLDPPKTGARDDSIESRDEHLAKFEKQLTGLLLCENLVVLTGLGTSLCVKNEKGDTLAPTMAALWQAAAAAAGNKFDQIKERVNFTEKAENIEYLLSRCQMSEKLRPDPLITKFVTETEKLIVQKCRFFAPGMRFPVHEAFLRKVARRSTRLPRMKLFTTNYDVCFERAGSAARFVMIDGFSHSDPREFDGSYFNYDLVQRGSDGEVPGFIPNVFHLYKLHGSLDWEQQGAEIVQNSKAEKPLIIYPRESKFESSYDQPFLEMMAAFQGVLRQPNTGLLIVGFGFNDHHITQPILSAVRANTGLKMMVVSPTLESAGNASLEEVKDLIKRGDSRLSMLASGFEQIVEVMPDLVASTEEEIHRQRLKGKGGRA